MVNIDFEKDDFFKLLVTPEIATEWLERNYCNRPILEPQVEDYVRAMHNGNWVNNGDTVKFSKTGELIDGQHRLTAIKKSGIAQFLLITTGLEKTTHIDDGRKRSPRDQVLVSGRAKKGEALADTKCIATANFLYSYWKTGNGRCHSRYERLPISEVMDWMEKHIDAMNLILSITKKHFVSSISTRAAFILAAVVVCYLNGIEEEKLRKWYDVVRTGEYNDPTHLSAVVFRNKVIQIGRRDSNDRTKLFLQAQNSIKDFGVKPTRILKESKAFPFNWNE